MGRGVACAGLPRDLSCVDGADSLSEADFFVVASRMLQLMSDKKFIGYDAQTGMVMKAPPMRPSK